MKLIERVLRRLFLCAACLLAGTAHGQLSNDPLMNLTLRQAAGMQSMADMLVDAAKSAGELRGLMANASSRVATARQRYWAEYPSGPGLKAAKQEFDAALRSKDYFYLLATISNGHVIFGTVGGLVDDGIPFTTRKSFDAWTAEVMKNLMEDSSSMVSALANTQEARAKIIRADPHYLSYVIRRDLEEFRRAGKTPPGVNAEAWRIAVLGAEITQNPPDDPYTTAFTVVARGKNFASQCPTVVSDILHKQMTAANCSCLHGLVKKDLYGSWALETDLTAERFLIASVSGAGTADKVASCLRK